MLLETLSLSTGQNTFIFSADLISHKYKCDTYKNYSIKASNFDTQVGSVCIIQTIFVNISSLLSKSYKSEEET